MCFIIIRIWLLPKEFDIISFLSQNKGIVFDRETIYEKVWGLDGIGDNTVVTEHIRRIRAKFLSLGDRPYIETVWGADIDGKIKEKQIVQSVK